MDQRKLVEAMDHYSTLFHECYYNNYSLVLTNKRLDLSVFIQNRKQLMNKLNIASYNLQAFCRLCLQDSRLKEQMSDTVIGSLDQICNNWAQQIKEGNSFLTYDYAEVIINTLTQAEYPFIEKLYTDQYKVIPAAFVSIPFNSKSFTRIHNYSDPARLPMLLDGLFNLFHKDRALYYYIERIEIARNDFPLKLESSNEEYPLFSIFFDHRIVNTGSHPVIRELTERIKPLLDNGDAREVRLSYSFPVYADTAISQGFKNYKRFLDLVGALDNVYERETNYAFVK
jgi:hypothetical protein